MTSGAPENCPKTNLFLQPHRSVTRRNCDDLLAGDSADPNVGHGLGRAVHPIYRSRRLASLPAPTVSFVGQCLLSEGICVETTRKGSAIACGMWNEGTHPTSQLPQKRF